MSVRFKMQEDFNIVKTSDIKISDLINLWHYVSLYDGIIDEHERVAISFHLAQEYGSEIKSYLEKMDSISIEKDIQTIISGIQKEYTLEKQLELLLSLYLFFLHEEKSLSDHPLIKEIFEKLNLENYLLFFENIFRDGSYHVENGSHLTLFKDDVKIYHELFSYVFFEIGDKCRLVIREGESLFIDGHQIKSKNRAIVLRPKQRFTFENKEHILELSYDEIILFLKDENRADILKKIVPNRKILRKDEEETIKTIEIKNLYCGFDKKFPRTKNLTISVEQNDLIAIIGPSGSGKSTFLKTIMGMNYINNGTLTINGTTTYRAGDEHKLSQYIRHIGYVSQQELFVKELSVYDNLYYYYSLFHTQKKEKKEFEAEIQRVLQQLGIYEQLHQNTTSLSGGQRKKLNIALELIKNPDVLFIDEPTSGLSSQEAVELIEFLRELSKEGKMVFTVIHQPSMEMYQKYNKVIILNQEGYNIYSGDAQEALKLFSSVLSEDDGVSDPNILLKTNKKQEDFWYTLGYLKRFLEAKS